MEEERRAAAAASKFEVAQSAAATVAAGAVRACLHVGFGPAELARLSAPKPMFVGLACLSLRQAAEYSTVKQRCYKKWKSCAIVACHMIKAARQTFAQIVKFPNFHAS